MTQKAQGDVGQAGQTDPGLPPADSVQVDHANMAPEIKEEPGRIPLPVIGTRPEDFEADGGYLASRPSGHFTSSPTGLGLLLQTLKTFHSSLETEIRTTLASSSASGHKICQHRRIRGRDEDDESPTKRRRSRRQGQPAYFGVGISSGKGEEKVSFDIKDHSNQIAAAKYVEWSIHTDGDIEDLKRRAFARWERSEQTRIRESNQKISLLYAYCL
ncbi:hypothetical protein FCOIX_7231 [Fusarium coicis]|nr:hypothetical protein FCOIX_7231 [Fusarium coicis]